MSVLARFASWLTARDDLAALTKREKGASTGATAWTGTLPSKRASKKESTPEEKDTREQGPAGGQGAGSPPRLDTLAKRSVTLANNTGSSSEGERAGASAASRTAGNKGPRRARYRLGRPVRQSEPTWRAAYVAELRKLGRRHLAERVEECGQVVASIPCSDPSCGEKHAHQTILASCSARGCCHCARESAQSRRERLLPALHKVPEFFAARRASMLAEQRERWEEARDASHFHFAKMQQAQARYEKTLGSRALASARTHKKRFEESEALREKHGFFASRLGTKNKRGDLERWDWRLITLAPQWDPRSSESYTVEGLSRRWQAIVDRWSALRAALGPAAQAVVSVELSDGGHVHLHALVFAPEYLAKPWLQAKVGPGCFVDIRKLDVQKFAHLGPQKAVERALREAVKYAVKQSSPLNGLWLAGARRKLVHPELAARWTVATHRRQLGRVYGELLRDALASCEPDTDCERGRRARARCVRARCERERFALPSPAGARCAGVELREGVCSSEKKQACDLAPIIAKKLAIPTCWSCGRALTAAPEYLPTATVAGRLGRNWGKSCHWKRPFRDVRASGETEANSP